MGKGGAKHLLKQPVDMAGGHIQGLGHHVDGQVLGVVGVDVFGGGQRDVFIAQGAFDPGVGAGHRPQQVEKELAVEGAGLAEPPQLALAGLLVNLIQQGLLGLGAVPSAVLLLVDVGQLLDDLPVLQLQLQGSGGGFGHDVKDHGEIGGRALRRVTDTVQTVLAQQNKVLRAQGLNLSAALKLKGALHAVEDLVQVVVVGKDHDGLVHKLHVVDHQVEAEGWIGNNIVVVHGMGLVFRQQRSHLRI